MTDETTNPVADTTQPRRTGGGSARRRRTRIVLGIVLALLVLLLTVLSVFVLRLMSPVGTPDKADLVGGFQWVRSIYGWGKADSQQLYKPSDTAIAPDGTVWVTDPQRFQIVGFNPDGSYKTLIHQGPGFMMPQTLAISDDNEIYVGDYLNGKIRVFSAANKELRSWVSTQPTELDVRDGKVVVGSLGTITVWDTQGKLISQWGERGKTDAQLDIVRGVAIGEDGTIFVSDTQNSRVKAYAADGKLKWVYPSNKEMAKFAADKKAGKKTKPPFQIPSGMTIDGAGRLVLVDPFEFNIMVLDTKNGRVLKRYADYGEQDGKFAYPTSISYDPSHDWFAVADTANNRAQIVRIPSSGGSPLAAVARASVGPVWVCSVPLLLLLLAVVIMVLRRRKNRSKEPLTDSSPDAE